MNNSEYGNRIKNDRLKYIDYESNRKHENDYDEDDDNDSLGSALSDYNGIFYDAPTTSLEPENPAQKLIKQGLKPSSTTTLDVKEGSVDISFEDRTDEDSFNLDDDDICYVDSNQDNATLSNGESPSLSSSESDCDIDLNDQHIDKELFNYLNNDGYDTCEDFEKSKIKQLENLELGKLDNIDLVRQMAIEKYGFVNKKFRRKAWPLLILHKNKSNRQPIKEQVDSSLSTFRKISAEQIKNTKYFEQVTLDVVRTLKRFPPEISDKLRLKLQKQLIDLICKILIKYDKLHYYQGYHDICLTFLLVAGADDSLPLLESITLSHLTLFMETTMESTLKLLFNIMPLIDNVNSQVAEHIQRAELGVIFGLSWLITWYSHVMDNLKIILRLYDFFIATDPLMPIYLGAIIVTDKADEILSIDCDMASLHTVITKYPTKINDIEQLENYILKTLNLFEKCPPKSLPVMNEKWLDKCQRLQEEIVYQANLEQENYLKQRNKKNKNSNNNNNSSDNKKLAKRKNFSLSRLKNPNNHIVANRFLVGLTFTVGVAAVAMYAINTNVVKDTPDFFSKFYQFLSLKEF